MFKKPIHIGTARTAMKPNRSGSLFILFAFTLAMLLLLDGSLVYGEPIEGEEYQGKWYCFFLCEFVPFPDFHQFIRFEKKQDFMVFRINMIRA